LGLAQEDFLAVNENALLDGEELFDDVGIDLVDVWLLLCVAEEEVVDRQQVGGEPAVDGGHLGIHELVQNLADDFDETGVVGEKGHVVRLEDGKDKVHEHNVVVDWQVLDCCVLAEFE
jgi:hypothetical protein